jgi:hypothetical protein
LEWAPNIAADFAAQSLKSAAWLLGYPTLVAVTRGNPDPGFPLRLDTDLTRWQEPVYSLFAQPWMPLVGLLGMLAWLLRVSNRSYREAVGLAALLSALLTYPALRESLSAMQILGTDRRRNRPKRGNDIVDPKTRHGFGCMAQEVRQSA